MDAFPTQLWIQIICPYQLTLVNTHDSAVHVSARFSFPKPHRAHQLSISKCAIWAPFPSFYYSVLLMNPTMHGLTEVPKGMHLMPLEWMPD